MTEITIELYHARYGEAKCDLSIDDMVYENLDIITIIAYLTDYLASPDEDGGF